MFETTSAIILHCQKYNDKAVILHTYTQTNGRMNFIVYNNVIKRVRGILGTPLSIVELSYENKSGQEMYVLHSLSPILLLNPDEDRIFIRTFLTEVLYKTLRHPMADERIYAFLQECIRIEAAGKNPLTTPLNMKEFMEHFSVLLGYGGKELEEWGDLESVKLLQEWDPS